MHGLWACIHCTFTCHSHAAKLVVEVDAVDPHKVDAQPRRALGPQGDVHHVEAVLAGAGNHAGEEVDEVHLEEPLVRVAHDVDLVDASGVESVHPLRGGDGRGRAGEEGPSGGKGSGKE